MKRQKFASVWDAIESAENAASLKLRADVAHELIEELRRRRLSQARAATLLNVTQPRISDLMRGQLHLFSLEGLIAMAGRVGLEARVSLSRSRAA
jgi:predicted XRE-type DNA-binding protein